MARCNVTETRKIIYYTPTYAAAVSNLTFIAVAVCGEGTDQGTVAR